MTRFESKIALVTGGRSGIGKAIAKRLAAEGARVFTAQRGEDDELRIGSIKHHSEVQPDLHIEFCWLILLRIPVEFPLHWLTTPKFTLPLSLIPLTFPPPALPDYLP